MTFIMGPFIQAGSGDSDPEAFTAASMTGVQEDLKGPKLKIESDHEGEACPHSWELEAFTPSLPPTPLPPHSGHSSSFLHPMEARVGADQELI